jgi:dephospho-CoA kinase
LRPDRSVRNEATFPRVSPVAQSLCGEGASGTATIMLRIGITGGIACGKSLAGICVADQGIPVCDADDLAHEAMRPGMPVYDRVVGIFGRAVLAEGGEIDRRTLGAVVFADPARRAQLDAAVRPAVRDAWTRWLESRPGARAAAVIVPLLYEAGAGAGWDAVICVAAPRKEQMERLRRRGFSDAEAQARVDAQMPIEEKMERADYVLYNAGTKELLALQMERALQRIMET